MKDITPVPLWCNLWRYTGLTNKLSPKVQIQILHTSVHTLRYRISWENLIKDQSISFVFIILLILLTFSIDDVLIWLGENWCWSLLGLQGLTNADAQLYFGEELFIGEFSIWYSIVRLRGWENRTLWHFAAISAINWFLTQNCWLMMLATVLALKHT